MRYPMALFYCMIRSIHLMVMAVVIAPLIFNITMLFAAYFIAVF